MNTDIYKTKLEEEKAILVEELSGLGKLVNKKTGDWEAAPESEDYSKEVEDEASMSERAEDYEERSSKLAVLKSRLIDVDKALERIENGTYGICTKCNKPIEKERLEANPATEGCNVCM